MIEIILIPDVRSATAPLLLAVCGEDVSPVYALRVRRLFVMIALPVIRNTTPPVVSPSLIMHLPLSA